jgi:hypothetical protein
MGKTIPYCSGFRIPRFAWSRNNGSYSGLKFSATPLMQ